MVWGLNTIAGSESRSRSMFISNQVPVLQGIRGSGSKKITTVLIPRRPGYGTSRKRFSFRIPGFEVLG